MRKSKFLTIIMTLVLLLSIALTSCGKANNTNSSKNGNISDGQKILTVQVGPDEESIDPAFIRTIATANMLLHLYEGLLVVDKDGELKPGQAESWDVSEDGLTWTFHLRDDLKWSDGSDLTAKDFEYSWKRIADPKTASPYAETVLFAVKGFKEAQQGDIDALQAVAKDEKTFEVTLDNPCPYFGEVAAFQTLSPVQKKVIDEKGESWAIEASTYVCNGPFEITEWIPGSHIITAKNPNYYNADKVKLDAIKWLLTEDGNAAYSAYKSGEAQMIKEIPTEEMPSLEGREDFHVEPIMGTYYLLLNHEVKPFQDKNLRRALSLAIDREYVTTTLMHGTYLPAYNFFGPGWADPLGGEFIEKANGGKPYISEDFKANLEEAKELMKKAGYKSDSNNPDLKFTFTTNDSLYYKIVAEYLQQAWKEIGVELEINIVEMGSLASLCRAGDYEIARMGWIGDFSDPTSLLLVNYSTNGNNDARYNNPDYDAAINKSITNDARTRSEAFHEAEDILMNDMGVVPLAYFADPYLLSPKVKDAWHSARGYWIFTYADIEE